MNIEGIIWLNQIIDKLAFKHRIETNEVEEVFTGKPKFRFVEKGERKNEDVYMALGQTEGGRYLIIYLFTNKAGKRSF
jgi:uncharacterized DUF497 family protein